MIEYHQCDLFLAPEGSILVHACNAKGVWGSGIAKEFKRRFPLSFEQYEKYCKQPIEITRGSCLLVGEGQFGIGCLITSNGYGKHVDDPETILLATRSAFNELLEQIGSDTEIHMPKINSGLFNVPWELTEQVLNQTLNDHCNIHRCVVYEL